MFSVHRATDSKKNDGRAADGKADAKLSRDGTLRWRWEHRADGTRYAAAEYFYQGRWLTAIEQSLAPTGD